MKKGEVMLQIPFQGLHQSHRLAWVVLIDGKVWEEREYHLRGRQGAENRLGVEAQPGRAIYSALGLHPTLDSGLHTRDCCKTG